MRASFRLMRESILLDNSRSRQGLNEHGVCERTVQWSSNTTKGAQRPHHPVHPVSYISLWAIEMLDETYMQLSHQGPFKSIGE